MARSSFFPCRIEELRLAKTSRGSLSRSCLTPSVLIPKYCEVGPGIPSSLKPGATRGSRLEISVSRALRGVIVAAVMGGLSGNGVQNCCFRKFQRSNSQFVVQYARNDNNFVQELQKITDEATLTTWPDIAPR